MPLNKHSADDLEYLAELGYTKMPTAQADVNDLRHKLKLRYGKSPSPLWLIGSSIVIGSLAGTLLFFTLQKYTTEPKVAHALTQPIQPTKPQVNALFNTLDTLEIKGLNPTRSIYKNESFSKPLRQNPISIQPDSVYVLNSRLPDVKLTTDEKEASPIASKYIANAPFLFIHNLKVSNYHQLYFKKNLSIDLEMNFSHNVEAANENKETKSLDAFLNSGRQRHYYLHQALSDALYYFSTEQYKNAQNLFYRIKSYTKQDVNCDFYLAMSYYYEKEPLTALKYFNLVLESSNTVFLPEAHFYKALCLIESNEPEKGKALLKQIASEGGFYSQKALLYLNGN